MNRAVVLAAAGLVLTAPCLARAQAPSGTIDPRIRVVRYDPWAVVPLAGAFRTATEILLGDDETIQHVAVGDTTGWDVVAERNILFVKPKAERAPTNLIITTRRDSPSGSSERHYMFALTTRREASAKALGETIFALRFLYPADAPPAAAQTVSPEAAALEAKVLQLKLERAVLEGHRNLAYSVQGDVSLQPSEISDNGRFTVLRFPGNQAIPAIYEVTDNGEGLVAFDVRGEFVVIHAVSKTLRLRRGRQVLCIYNDAFAPYGGDNVTNTAAKDVQRTDRSARP